MYTQELKLKHNETAAILNIETGEVKPVTKRKNNIPEGKEIWQPKANFTKTYGHGWKYLEKILTDLEYKVAHRMSLMAKAYTNSLEPLGENTTIKEISEVFGMNRNKASKTVDKLFKEGVFAKFECYDYNQQHTKYWVFNPYLSFSGRVINKSIANLFENTMIAKLNN